MERGEATDDLDLRGQRYKVLLSLREDFLPAVEGWKRELPSLMRNRLRLMPMSADRAWQVVTGIGPTGKTHELVDDMTARTIVGFVAGAQLGDVRTGTRHAHRKPRKPRTKTWDELEIKPVLLSLVCEGLNRTRKADGRPVIDSLRSCRRQGTRLLGILPAGASPICRNGRDASFGV